MKTGHYAVVRYIADPARNEALNVGIVLWDDAHYQVKVDADAARRALRDNRRIAPDALASLQEALESEITGFQHRYTSIDGALREWLDMQRGFPISLTDVRYVGLSDAPNDHHDIYDEAVSRLIARLVHPVRTYGPRRVSRGTALWELHNAFEPFVNQGTAMRKYRFQSSKSGVPRSVDYYANHGANLAFEAFRSGRGTSSEIQSAADAEAYKIEDITRANAEVTVVVYFPEAAESASMPVRPDARRHASQTLANVGAQLVTHIDEAQRVMQEAISRRS